MSNGCDIPTFRFRGCLGCLPGFGLLHMLIDLPDFTYIATAIVQVLHAVHTNSMRALASWCISFCNSGPEFFIRQFLGLDWSKVCGLRVDVLISIPVPLLVSLPTIVGEVLLL